MADETGWLSQLLKPGDARNKLEPGDARKNLLDLLDRLTKFAGEATAAPAAEHQIDLVITVALLENAVAALLPNLSAADQVMHLQNALQAAFSIGSLASKDLARQVRRRQTEAATGQRHPGSDVINKKIAKLYKQGKAMDEIEAQTGVKADAVKKRIQRMLKTGQLKKRLQKRRRKAA
jgi:hypothetical protein